MGAARGASLRPPLVRGRTGFPLSFARFLCTESFFFYVRYLSIANITFNISIISLLFVFRDTDRERQRQRERHLLKSSRREFHLLFSHSNRKFGRSWRSIAPFSLFLLFICVAGCAGVTGAAGCAAADLTAGI